MRAVNASQIDGVGKFSDRLLHNFSDVVLPQ